MIAAAAAPLRFAGHEMRLLIGGRTALFLGADAVLLGAALLASLLAGGELPAMYELLVLLPMLTLGVLGMADAVALERRAGCLDLVLALPESWRYFERRLAIAGGALAAQGWLVVVALWATSSLAFPLLPALLHAASVAVFLAAASLFWGVHLESPGAVAAATLASAALAGRWITHLPVPPREESGGILLGSADSLASTLAACAMLLVLAALLVAFERRRLARGEALLP